jgi:hypothetical protein
MPAYCRRSWQWATRLKQAKLRRPATVEEIDFRNPGGLERPVPLSLAQGDWVEAHHHL